MEQISIEASYPLSFRKEEAKELGEHLKNRHSVVLVGMKRVGISNFLRFFLNHKATKKTYIADNKEHLFIPVDLNDLVERELFPFWSLTLKRIVDAVEKSSLSEKIKKDIESLFLQSIQSQDLFFTIDSIRKALLTIVSAGVLPTIFFVRFDRIKDAVVPAFYDNLNGLVDATHQKLVFVFTSFKSLDKLAPAVFTRASLSVFARRMYIKPAKHADIKVIYDTYRERYKLLISEEMEDALFRIVDGYVQYLQLTLILLHEQQVKVASELELYELLAKDERIILQSEELWESLEEEEKIILQKVVDLKKIGEADQEKSKYLWDTGIVSSKNGKTEVFSPLFKQYVVSLSQKEKEKTNTEFTKKENLLFSFLKNHANEISEREDIIEAVWPEVTTLGVTDWAVDRLVARVRGKLRVKGSFYKIETIKTRGYKLVVA
ncbi:MAG: helix-turn-helix domain-containing protein [Candidatus Levybacteria bacterium]|nr:helix-turn-helix domain-containing protein [Candidatus Levybacteria bacterium]